MSVPLIATRKTTELPVNGELPPSQQGRRSGGRPGRDRQTPQEEEAVRVPPVASVQPLAQVPAAGQSVGPAEVAVRAQPGLRPYDTSLSYYLHQQMCQINQHQLLTIYSLLASGV